MGLASSCIGGRGTVALEHFPRTPTAIRMRSVSVHPERARRGRMCGAAGARAGLRCRLGGRGAEHLRQAGSGEGSLLPEPEPQGFGMRVPRLTRRYGPGPRRSCGRMAAPALVRPLPITRSTSCSKSGPPSGADQFGPAGARVEQQHESGRVPRASKSCRRRPLNSRRSASSGTTGWAARGWPAASSCHRVGRDSPSSSSQA